MAQRTSFHNLTHFHFHLLNYLVLSHGTALLSEKARHDKYSYITIQQGIIL